MSQQNSGNKKSFWNQLLCGSFFPLLLFAIMACTYAVQLPNLGFYLDDWVSIAAYDQGGESGLIAYGTNDSRPFAAWITAKFFALLGIGVLQWQLITLFWRFAAALCCRRILVNLWPGRRAEAGYISILFGIFPFFKHQAICIAYFMILMQYFVILLSFYLTILALKTENKPLKGLFFVLSLLTSLFHLVCLEYYLSLEAARLVIIYLILRKRDGRGFKQTALKTAGLYIPYALVLAGILGYRFLYIPSLSKDVRPITLLSKYKGLNLPIHLFSLLLQYLSESLLGIWYRSINPLELDLTMRNAQLGLGLGAIAAAAIFILLYKTAAAVDEDRDMREMLILGTCAMLLGYLPGMSIDVSPSSTSAYHDRYLLPSFWGIALFTLAWVSLIFKNQKLRFGLFSGIICLSVFFQIQNSFMYRYSWKYQQQFQWSMKWRIPDLEENTAIFSDGSVASFMGGWADSSMILEMYGKKQGITPTPYWYFNVAEDNYLSSLETRQPLYVQSKMYRFETEAENALIMTKPEYGKCVWVLDEADTANPFLESGIGAYIPYQNKNRIRLSSDHTMPEAIFGSDYIHDWCYYFEKADLAFDKGEYETVLALYQEAENSGISMGNPTEMRPFIKAAAWLGNWEKALEWSQTANSKYPGKTTEYFQNLWKIIDRDAPSTGDKASAVSRAFALFDTSANTEEK